MSSITEIRKTVLPRELYEVIERFMFGEIVSLQITAMTNTRQIKHYSFGFTPEAIEVISDNQKGKVFKFPCA